MRKNNNLVSDQIQSQKEARSVRYQIQGDMLLSLCSIINKAVTAQLICTFVFAYACCLFSYAMAPV